MHRLKPSSISRIIDRSINEVYIFHPRTLQFLYANYGAQKNLRYSMDELETMTPLDLKPDFSETEFRALLQPLLDGSARVIRFETYHLRKDWSRYTVDVSVEIEATEAGSVFVAMIRDITREVTERNAKDAIVSDLETLNQFISHDMVAPLRQGLFICNQLEEKFPDEADLQKMKIILSQARDMVRGFALLHENTTTHDFRYHRLADLVQTARTSLDPATSADLDDVHGRYDTILFCDSRLMVQVFKNLFENAVKYRKNAKASVDVTYQNHGNVVQILVTDNGSGIAEENFERVFTLRFREKQNGSATGKGIGLALCSRIMKHHKGRIFIRESSENGSTFVLELPGIRARTFAAADDHARP